MGASACLECKRLLSIGCKCPNAPCFNFHWYYPDGGQLWGEVASKAGSLADMGITDVWLPPAGKGATGGYSVGYDAYHLFDLGEFDQEGTIATKYGDRAALERRPRLWSSVQIMQTQDFAIS